MYTEDTNGRVRLSHLLGSQCHKLIYNLTSRRCPVGCPGSSGLPRGYSGEEYACNAKDVGLIPEPRRSPGEGNGHPLQYSWLGNPMDRGAWWAAVRGVAGQLDVT